MPLLALALALTAQIFCTNLVICTPDYTYTVKNLCSQTEFDPNSAYRTNLNTILDNLAQNSNISTNNGYYATNTTALLGGGGTSNDSDSDIIYGLFLCRGDISSSDCYGCVSTATGNMPPEGCPTDTGAVIWYDMCMVRYSNVSFLGILDYSIVHLFMKNGDDVDADNAWYPKLAGDTLQSLAIQLGASPSSSMPGDKKYFATANPAHDSSFLKLYTMAQCTADLSPGDCKICTQMLINEFPTYCNDSLGCRMLNPSCIVRYDGYQFYDLPKASPSPPPLPPSSTAPIVALKISLGCFGLLLVILVAVFMFLLCRKERTNNDDGNAIITLRSQSQNFDIDQVTSVKSLQYDLATLIAATHRFSDVNKIGEGGFGGVYKGTLPNGVEIAVKRLSKDSGQGLEQFKNEVVLVAKHQHRNLVRLLGFCLTADEMLLVYEFVCNKSLDLMLFGPSTNTRGHLDWPARYKIINGIARGLLYLHEDSRLKIVHRDLKASNILLDADMNPKISDFGLARNFSGGQEQEHTARLAGTLGYMAPEYIEYGEYSTKSDVYSFGVLALEIVSGKKISNRQIGLDKNLLTYAWKHWNEETISSFVDPTIGDLYSTHEVKRCIHLGLLCVQGDAEQRPSMIKVVSYLNSNVDFPAPQQPTSVASVKLGSRSGTRELHYSDKSSSSSVKLGSGSRTGEHQYSDKSIIRSRTTASQTNLSTSISSQSFPGTDESC